LTSGWGDPMKNNFKIKITEIRVTLSGTETIHNGTILTIAWDADAAAVVPYLGANGLV